MIPLNIQLRYLLGLFAFVFLAGCVPEAFTRPTLHEARLGKGHLLSDTTLQPGEVRAEVIQIDPVRQEIRVRRDAGRPEPLTYTYNINTTRVHYHDREYTVDALEAGDIIAFSPSPRTSRFIENIRLQEPVQARAGSRIAREPSLPRTEVIEGTVERIDYDRGLFEVRPRFGRTVAVTVPYNARGADIESFRRLRRGDYVRIEGDFVTTDSFQLFAFLADSPSSRLR